ncbi:MAG: hypothetical protein F4205_18225 [Gemmatimonadetes bacterium]|nr:hypothetical protein [Gemmatimonadota bacterium]MXX72787.1 hypothetical protein [Gemmatimonadota bacterium]MYC91289.1 hypothetical protein [Gemmatimonadota bacterium]MYG37411.1 hypothetical protein [Gemmatimonadota bacterium]
MSERTVEKVLELEARIERVWRAITDPAELARWFGDEAEIDLRPGGDAAMAWREHGRYAMRIEEVQPPTRLVWSWVHEPGIAFEDAPTTRVEWTLTPREDGGTTLHLRETGFRTDLHRGQNDEGWDAELGELSDLLAGRAP